MFEARVQTTHGTLDLTLDRDDGRLDAPARGIELTAATSDEGAISLQQLEQMLVQHLMGFDCEPHAGARFPFPLAKEVAYRKTRFVEESARRILKGSAVAT